MTTLSLKARLLLASALGLSIFLMVAGLVIDHTYKASLLKAQQQRMQLQIEAMISTIELQEGTLQIPKTLYEARFSQPQSGLYAYIHDENNQQKWQSPSLLEPTPKITAILKQQLNSGEHQYGTITHNDMPHFYYSYQITWEQEQQQELPFRFTLLEHQQPLLTELNTFRQQLWILGTAAIIFLALIQWLIMTWGLKPLKQIARELKKIKHGESQQLSHKYPKEINPITTNLNALLTHERQQQQHYRHALDDLAHSLKTPIAVMQTQQDPQTIQQQLEQMHQTITHQLQRAKIRTPHALMGTVTIKPTAERIIKAMQKIYQDKNINTELICKEETKFYGDEQDLIEILGNLLDNAHKYGQSQVKITISTEEKTLTITIEDDGPGITKQNSNKILQRNTRADTTKPGYGIGLAMVQELVEHYQGQLKIKKSTLGGSKIELIFLRTNK